jgi:UDP-N-acetylmuramoylalanine--D-glutamate ligase
MRSATSTNPATHTLIVGLGKTGLSCARYLRVQGPGVAVTDSRTNPPCLAQLTTELPDVPVFTGRFQAEVFAAADRLVVSPGVPVAEPMIQAALARGVPVVGDIELFAQAIQAPVVALPATAPALSTAVPDAALTLPSLESPACPPSVVAITGSNGKSTVTTLVGLMARRAGVQVAVGGNIGDPALELIDPTVSLYVLELSSFQLETTSSLRPRAATVLNLSPDHMDRYPDYAAYIAAKARVYQGAEVAVVNRDDAPAAAIAHAAAAELGFTLGRPVRADDFGLLVRADGTWLARGDRPLLPAADLGLAGRHNQANALAALALGSACGLPEEAMLVALQSFRGLPHRSALVGERDGVRWYNDSKGTNPGATVAALDGLVEPGSSARVVLIAGGDGKGADFTPLKPAVERAARAVVLIGRDAPLIEAVLTGRVPLLRAGDMADAVRQAAGAAEPGDCILLSPACASFDMFDNYEHRGLVFTQAVERWIG